jgi:hypothetical protein
MARRKKATRRRRKPALNLYDMGVAYGNLAIITNATLGSGPIEALGGAYDIGYTRTQADVGLGRGSQMLALTGASQVSLADIMNAPSMSFEAIMSNARTNAVPAALAAISFNIGASVFKKIMRKPFNQANKLIKPLGLNVRIG